MAQQPHHRALSPIPWAPVIACLALLSGTALTAYALLILAGLGWAVLVVAVPFLALSAVIFRGLMRGK